jgi:hypothetical protein
MASEVKSSPAALSTVSFCHVPFTAEADPHNIIVKKNIVIKNNI